MWSVHKLVNFNSIDNMTSNWARYIYICMYANICISNKILDTNGNRNYDYLITKLIQTTTKTKYTWKWTTTRILFIDIDQSHIAEIIFCNSSKLKTWQNQCFQTNVDGIMYCDHDWRLTITKEKNQKNKENN